MTAVAAPSQYDLRRRLQRSAYAVAYILVSVPIGLLGAVTVLFLVIGAALSVFGIGLPILLAAAAAGRWLAGLDRRAANRLLDTHLPPPPPQAPARGSVWRRSLTALSDRGLWRIAGLLAVKPLLAIGTLVAALAPIVLLAELLFLGTGGIGGFADIDFVGPWALDPALGAILLALAVPAAILAIAVLDGLYTVLCSFTRALLAPRAAPSGPVREMLAESLGDRSLSIAYWLPDRQAFVDETGRQVTLPEAGSGRSWTAVERDGQPVAAIVHDAAMDAGPELVHAAATAAGLAIDNERLKADLRARVEELRVSRLRIVEAGDAARRRLERDLHDGAQQQLVGLALDLHLLKSRLDDADAVAMVEEVAQKLQLALGELRELARGIHPAILTDRGLGPALDALASRSRFPVDIEVTIGEDLPPAVAAAAYFVVAEALTNVAKYAQADAARVEVAERDGAIHVLVSDDGVGGARGRTGLGPPRAPGPRRRPRRDAAARQPAGRGHPSQRPDPVRAARHEAGLAGGAAGVRGAGRVRRLVVLGVLAALALVLAACGESETVREPDLAAPAATSDRGTTAPSATNTESGVRIAVVTHGQASSSFWAIVRNGIDQARRQMDVRISYRAPDVYSVPRMRTLIDRAVATQAGRARRLDPGPAARRRDPPRGPRRASRSCPSTPGSTSSGASASWRTSASRRSGPARPRGGALRRRACGVRCASSTRRATSGWSSAATASRARSARRAARRARWPSTSTTRPRRAGSRARSRRPMPTAC